jgi:hypothetical protein
MTFIKLINVKAVVAGLLLEIASSLTALFCLLILSAPKSLTPGSSATSSLEHVTA